MTRYLNGDDLGDPFDHALREVLKDQEKVLSEKVNIGDGIAAVASFFHGELTVIDIKALYQIYNALGLGIGIKDVRGIDFVPKFIRNARAPQLIQNGILNFKEKHRPFLETTAWYIREGAVEGMRQVTQSFGSALLDTYLDDLISLKESGGNIESKKEAIKRVNAGYEVYMQVAEKQRDGKQEDWLEELDKIRAKAQENGLFEYCRDVEVAGRNESSVFLGVYAKDLSSFRGDYSPPVNLSRRVKNVLIQGTANVYKEVLTGLVRERYGIGNLKGLIARKNIPPLAETAEDITQHDLLPIDYLSVPVETQVVYPKSRETSQIGLTIDGWRLWAERPDLFIRLMSGGDFEGIVMQLRLLKERYGLTTDTLILRLFDSISPSREGLPLVAKYRAPIIEEIEGEYWYKYLTGLEEMELIILLGEALGRNGFTVTHPYCSSEEMLLNEQARGDQTLARYFNLIYFDKLPEVSEFKDVLLQGISELGAEAFNQARNTLMQYLGSLGYEPEYDERSSSIHYKQANGVTAVMLIDMDYYVYGETDREKYRGWTNWMVDSQVIAQRLIMIKERKISEGLADDEVRALVKRAIKENITLFDPVTKEVLLEKEASNVPIIKRPKIRTRNIPVSSAEIVEGSVLRLDKQ